MENQSLTPDAKRVLELESRIQGAIDYLEMVRKDRQKTWAELTMVEVLLTTLRGED